MAVFLPTSTSVLINTNVGFKLLSVDSSVYFVDSTYFNVTFMNVSSIWYGLLSIVSGDSVSQVSVHIPKRSVQKLLFRPPLYIRHWIIILLYVGHLLSAMSSSPGRHWSVPPICDCPVIPFISPTINVSMYVSAWSRGKMACGWNFIRVVFSVHVHSRPFWRNFCSLMVHTTSLHGRVLVHSPRARLFQ